MRVLVRLVSLAGCLLVGAATGLASVALHQLWWGLVLGVLAPAAALVALPPGWTSRLPFALGWIAMVGYLTVPRPEGDFVIGNGLAGYVLLAAAMAFLVAGLVTLPRRGAPERADPEPRMTA
ncbi:DUF6113 family protein [Nocardioides lianchengensis]|uniref:Uncharacterized protein n=1 Tax=Nocardioides lianchengensis TaxID=1045774 RepID=A0A1G6UY00_9ACTN|nr:hypothetical protein [Nocardioides lianchengensis]NYG11075.1 hypothetical protein [Nocardioides lianchengensis]SDD46249.1 hypothetical protein SAMN05421872_108128 [Nocardioides lianchengensis]